MLRRFIQCARVRLAVQLRIVGAGDCTAIFSLREALIKGPPYVDKRLTPTAELSANSDTPRMQTYGGIGMSMIGVRSRNMSRPAERLVSGDSACFDSRYEVDDFQFGHALAAQPEFAWDALRQLLARHLGQSENCYWSSGAVCIKDAWTAGTQNRPSLLETFASLATSQSLIILKSIETDPVLGPFVRLIMAELIARIGARLRNDILKARATLLIASPHRTTSYHMDGDTNFLFQITGRKSLYVHSKYDRRAVPETELESYFTGNANGAIFKEASLHTARQYPLCPGVGIHIPSGAPHWAHTGESVSIALSINFDLCSIERRARLYRMNARLRHIGLNPTAPGQSAGLDAIKLTLHGLMRAARRVATPRTTLVTPPGM